MPPKNHDPTSDQWTTGLCGCFTHMESCCMTMCCPCITFGRIANILDYGKTSCYNGAKIYVLLTFLTYVGCCFHSCSYRSKLRNMFKLRPSPCGIPDVLVHFCCEPFALCQEYRELENRGFNLAVGWDQNREARAKYGLDEGSYNRTTQMTNPVQQQMNIDNSTTQTTYSVPQQQMGIDDYGHEPAE